MPRRRRAGRRRGAPWGRGAGRAAAREGGRGALVFLLVARLRRDSPMLRLPPPPPPQTPSGGPGGGPAASPPAPLPGGTEPPPPHSYRHTLRVPAEQVGPLSPRPPPFLPPRPRSLLFFFFFLFFPSSAASCLLSLPPSPRPDPLRRAGELRLLLPKLLRRSQRFPLFRGGDGGRRSRRDPEPQPLQKRACVCRGGGTAPDTPLHRRAHGHSSSYNGGRASLPLSLLLSALPLPAVKRAGGCSLRWDPHGCPPAARCPGRGRSAPGRRPGRLPLPRQPGVGCCCGKFLLL